MYFKISLPDGQSNVLHHSKKSKISRKYLLNKFIFNWIVYNSEFLEKLSNIEQYKKDNSKLHKKELNKLQRQYKKNNVYNYCLSHWLWQGKWDKHKLNYEDKVKMLLDRCATFLLMGHFKKGMIMTEDRIDSVDKIEIPVSNTSDELNDLFFSAVFEDDDYNTQTDYSRHDHATNVLLNNYLLDDIYEIPYKKKDKYRQTRHYKICQLYKSKDKTVRRLYKIKNKDVKYIYYKKDNPNEKEIRYISPPDSLSEQDIKKWRNKNFRTVHRDNIYDYKTVRIKGNKKGIIDKTKPYKCAWCYVDTDNIFTFNNEKYHISEAVKQYQGKWVKVNRKGDKEIRYDMTHILVYQQDGKIYFFDENIDRIDNKYIKKVNK